MFSIRMSVFFLEAPGELTAQPAKLDATIPPASAPAFFTKLRRVIMAALKSLAKGLVSPAVSNRVPTMTAYNGADNLAPALRRHHASPCWQQVSLNSINQIALAQSFPVQSISRIKHYLRGVGCSRRALSRTKNDFNQRFSFGPLLG